MYYIPQVNSHSAENGDEDDDSESDDEGKQGMGPLYGKSHSSLQALPPSASSSSVNGGEGSSILQ